MTLGPQGPGGSPEGGLPQPASFLLALSAGCRMAGLCLNQRGPCHTPVEPGPSQPACSPRRRTSSRDRCLQGQWEGMGR